MADLKSMNGFNLTLEGSIDKLMLFDYREVAECFA